MPFSLEERTALLALKGVGPTVITRLEQMGIESLDALSHCGRGTCEKRARTQPSRVSAFTRFPQGGLVDCLADLAWFHCRQHD